MEALNSMKFSELLDAYLDLRGQDAESYEDGYKVYYRRLDELRAAMDAKIDGKAVPAASAAGDSVTTFADIKALLVEVTTHQGLCSLNDDVERRFNEMQLSMTDADWKEWTLLVAGKASQFDATAAASNSGRTMTYDEFSAPLSPTESPVFSTKDGGFIVISRPDLGSFPKSYRDALDALAREQGITLKD